MFQFLGYLIVFASPFLGVVTFLAALFWEIEFWHAVALGAAVGAIPRILAHAVNKNWRELQKIAIAPFQMLLGIILVLLIGIAISVLLGPLLRNVLPDDTEERDLCDRYRCR